MDAAIHSALTAALDLPATADEREARELFTRLAAGQREPLGAIYDVFATELYALALWRTGRREDAEDAVQEVFVRLATTGADLTGVTRPRAYLLAMVHRAAVDRLRGRRDEAGPAAETFLETTLLAPERALDAARMSAVLAQLPGSQRAVIWLHHFAELTFREIGRVTGVPTFTAASRYRLGLRRLRTILGARP